MRTKGNFEEIDAAQRLFEKLLKNSDHFADVVNTHRFALDAVIGTLVAAVADQSPTLARVMMLALAEVQLPTGRPGLDAERQLLTRTALAAMQQRVATVAHRA
ncbi:hypothetical protein [Herbaspirillum sp. NPDC101396]|uniref:hypothetical protein n=1 Tax=Herbaspirillum sp. NPDC101396 TaxID=3364005 RepID=UPI00383AC1F7